MIWVNGVKQHTIEITDRGFQYGDGLFETIEIHQEQPVLITQHLQRLKIGCQRLKIPFSDFNQLHAEIIDICKNIDKAVLKIIITRGSGGRGYKLPDSMQPTRVISIHPFPQYPLEYNNEGISTRFCNTRLGLNPHLAGIKHLNRLEQILARSEWETTDIQEGIMLDINDNVIEGTMTNLFYIKEGIFYTANLNYCGIAGVIRQIIIEIIKNKHLTVIEHTFKTNELFNADEIFVCNSIIGIWRIKQINNHFFDAYLPNSIIPYLQFWLNEVKYKLDYV